MTHFPKFSACMRFGCLAAAALLLAAGTAGADTYSWNLTGDGDWNTATNWNGTTAAAPVNPGDVAVLGNTITSTAAVTFSNTASPGVIQFADLTGTKAYTVGTGSFSFTLNNNGSQAVIQSTSTVSSTGVQLIKDGVNVVGGAGLLADIQAGTVQVSGTLTSSGLTKTGGGSLVLSGDNHATLTGPIAVNGGVLQVTSVNALGPTTNAITVAAGGQLFINHSGFEVLSHTIHIAGDGPGAPAGQPHGALRFAAGSSAMYTAADIVLDADATIWLRNDYLFRNDGTKGLYIGTRTLTLAGDIGTTSSVEGKGINGTGNVVVDIPSGNVGFAGNGTYTGTTTINRGTVFLTAANGFGQSLGTLANAVTVNAAGQLTLNSGSYNVGNKMLILNGGSFNDNGGTKSWGGAIVQTAASAISAQGIGGVLTLTGGIDNGGFTLTLKTNFNDSVINVNGVGISGAGKVVVQPVTGNGTINLNATGTYTGGTDINAHKVYVNAASGTGTGPVNVNKPSSSGVGGQLSGTGSVAGAVTVAGGTLAPGAASAPGTLTLHNGVTFTTNASAQKATFKVRAPSTTSYDQLLVDGGAVNLGNATLIVDFTGLTGPIDPATRLYLIQTTGTGSLQASTFNGLPNGGVVGPGGGTTWVVFYDYGAGGDVYLTPVPEPATVLGCAAVGLAGAGLVRRRLGGRRVG